MQQRPAEQPRGSQDRDRERDLHHDEGTAAATEGRCGDPGAPAAQYRATGIGGCGRRNDCGDRGSEQRCEEGKQHRASADVQAIEPRPISWCQRDHRAEAPVGNPYPRGAADDAQHQCFNSNLPHQVTAARAESGSQRILRAAILAAHQEQVCKIRARDQ
jgi:hypothetical protein